MPQYYSADEAIYDHIDMTKDRDGRYAHKVTKEDGSIAWKVGKRVFSQKYNEAFEGMVLRGCLEKLYDGSYRLTERGEQECAEFMKINI